MGIMNIFLPDSLKTCVDEQVVSADFGTSSEYVRELTRTICISGSDHSRRPFFARHLYKGAGSPRERMH